MWERMASDALRSEDSALPADVLEQVAHAIAEMVPHNRALGITVAKLSARKVTLRLPWDERLIGNPEKRVIHGGAVTTLMDATCGTAVLLALREPVPVATLDLRIDYLKPGLPDRDVHAEAHCFKVARSVAFVRCEAFHPENPEDLIAVANGTFMVFRGNGQRRRRPR